MKSIEEEAEKFIIAVPELLTWFHGSKREMPWRTSPTPYHTWVSEIMLQQTRVETVIPYYERYNSELPDTEHLAHCEDDRLLKLWEGLGYYTRVRNMKKAALRILTEYGGRFPEQASELCRLPGIGPYTAGAISSIAFGHPEPVVDGNVLRIVSRILGLYDDISEERTKKDYGELLRSVLRESGADPGEFNQSLMELGAIRCLPNGQPLCDTCPVRGNCAAQRKGEISEIPVKTGKIKRNTVSMTVFRIFCGETLYIIRRPEQGLLSGLYGLPGACGELTDREAENWIRERGFRDYEIRRLPDGKHIFSHVEWHMKAYDVRAQQWDPDQAGDLIPVTREEVENRYALATAYKKWELL